MHMETLGGHKKDKKKYYDIRNATAEVLGIGDIVVKDK